MQESQFVLVRARVLGTLKEGEVSIIAASGPELAGGGLSTFVRSALIPEALRGTGSEFEVLLDLDSGEFVEVRPLPARQAS